MTKLACLNIACLNIFIALLLSSCQSDDKILNGYIEADLVYLSADFSGRLMILAVARGDSVKKGQLLFKLEQTSEQYRVKMSQLTHQALLAERKQILSKINYQQTNYQRIITMKEQNAASQDDLDLAKQNLAVLKEQLAEINAQIKNNTVNTALQQWDVAQKENYATNDGLIFDTYYFKGQFVSAGSPILSLLTPDHIKVVFFVPEKLLSNIKLHSAIKIMTATNPNFAIGHIAYISNIAEYTSPILYSREERQRLVFRVEAKIYAPNLYKMHLGQPVSLELTA